MMDVQLLDKLIDINTVSLCIQISMFVYFIISKWSKK